MGELGVLQTPLLEIVGRILLAMAFGAAVGWEREMKHKPAGLRTHMMVSVGAAVFALITLELFQMGVGLGGNARLDPIRTVEGIIGGIGFLGAGSIIQSRGSVEGITTAAGIWLVGAVGVACGMGLYALAVAAVLAALIILHLLAPLKWMKASRSHGQAEDGDEL